MRMLTLNECGLVTGGLIKQPEIKTAGGGTTSNTAHPDMLMPPGGYGSGGYCGGYIGNLYGIGDDYSDGFVYFGSQYSDTQVTTNDTLTTSSINQSTHTATATLWNSGGSEVAEGTLELAGAAVDLAGSLVASVATDGLFDLATAGVTFAVGLAGLYEGEKKVLEGAVRMSEYEGDGQKGIQSAPLTRTSFGGQNVEFA